MNLTEFLTSKRATDSDIITHTSFKGGKYCINSDDDYNKFIDCYHKSLQNKENIYLIERTSLNYKLFVDVDNDGLIDKDMIKELVEMYKECIKDYKDLDDVKMIFSHRNNFNRIHLNFTNIIVNNDDAIEIRADVISEMIKKYENIDWEKIIDISVYRNGGLRMLGSKKGPDDTSYSLYDIVNDKEIKTTKDILKKLQIRLMNLEKTNVMTIKDNKTTDDEKLIVDYIKSQDAFKDVIVKNIKTNDSAIFISLKNKQCPFVNRDHKRTMKSGNSPLYICITKNGMTMRCHNEECKEKTKPEQPIELSKEMKEMLNIQLDSQYITIRKSLSRTHYDVANFIYEVYKNKYRIEGVKNGDDWFEFDGQRWKKSFKLWNVISSDLLEYFDTFLEGDDNENLQSAVGKLITQLKTVSYKSALLKECSYLFHGHDPEFASRLDEDSRLMGFNNGVLDLRGENVVFRNGQPSDYMTMNTGIDYIENVNTDDVNSFLEKVFVDKEIREYVLKVTASCLLGGSDEHFHMWVGSGANGKSTYVQLVEKTFGDYAAKLPISLLTNKRGLSGNATPEIMRTRGRRFISMQEPDNDDDIKVGLMKELTGGDKIVGRELYKNSVEFLPQFKLFLCCNRLPTIPSTDEGTWRRLRVVEFKSKFKDEPKEGNEYEFQKDRALRFKMEQWKEPFMRILVDYYKQVIKEGIKEPEEVMKHTADYKKENDVLGQFVDSQLEPNDSSCISLRDIYVEYVSWCRSCGIRTIVTNLQFNKTFRSQYGNEKLINNKRGYKYSIIEEDIDE
jgi:P4 family phage/plasmid primase-like protien